MSFIYLDLFLSVQWNVLLCVFTVIYSFTWTISIDLHFENRQYKKW